MEARSILVLVGLLASAAVVADAYKWVDQQGVVHYSDRPQPGAERISLPGDGRAPAPPSSGRATRNTTEEQAADEAPFSYASLSIAAPAAEETLWNIEGVLSVSLELTPPLQGGHQIRVYLNGAPQLVNSQTFQLEEVYRGVHNLQAEVIDETGKMMIRSQPNRFYVQQNRVTQGVPVP